MVDNSAQELPTSTGNAENSCKHEKDEEIVITGISGRLPESNNMEEFKSNLLNGVDMITDDGRRWTPGLYGLPERAGKVKDLDKFDAEFFGVDTKEANLMDPQLRMMLELTYEAIIDAGVNPLTIRGTRTGVFVGAFQSETTQAFSQDSERINGAALTASYQCMFANRVSYVFDFKGPSFQMDTACSSSLLALERAVTSMRLGHCDAAIVGGLNVLLKPQSSLQFHRLNMLSADGKCKAFDASGETRSKYRTYLRIFIHGKEKKF